MYTQYYYDLVCWPPSRFLILALGIRAYVGSTPVTTDNAWKVASMHFGNASAADSIAHIVCFSPKNEKCLGEEATHHLFLFLAVSGVSVWVTQHCWLSLHCWAGQCLWGSSGQHWTTVRWLLLLFCFCFFFICLLFTMWAGILLPVISFSFSVVLTAVPLQLDIERWVWNIV